MHAQWALVSWPAKYSLSFLLVRRPSGLHCRITPHLLSAYYSWEAKPHCLWIQIKAHDSCLIMDTGSGVDIWRKQANETRARKLAVIQKEIYFPLELLSLKLLGAVTRGGWITWAGANKEESLKKWNSVLTTSFKLLDPAEVGDRPVS